MITNKYDQDLPDKVGENAKRLEELVNRVHWNTIGKAYAVGFTVLIGSVFVGIVVVRAALRIF